MFIFDIVSGIPIWVNKTDSSEWFRRDHPGTEMLINQIDVNAFGQDFDADCPQSISADPSTRISAPSTYILKNNLFFIEA
jgi:hypothetical protein